MDTLLIYQIKSHKEQLQAHKRHLQCELWYCLDKDIEAIISLEIEYINSILRAMEKARRKAKGM